MPLAPRQLSFLATMSPPHTTLGAMLIGFMVSTPIYGITCLQLYQYFSRYPKDTIWLKVAVASVWLLETCTQCMTSHAMYYYLILHESNVAELSTIVWSLLVPPLINGIEGAIVQTFFAWRIYIMSDKNVLLFSVICSLAVAQLGLSFAVTIQGLRFPNSAETPTGSEQVVSACFAIVAATDIIITLSLCYYLHIRKSGHERTNGIVKKLVVITINNGIFTSVVALAAFVTNLAAPTTMWTFALCFFLGKAYTNSLLSSLNSRTTSRHEFENPADIPLTSSSMGRKLRTVTSNSGFSLSRGKDKERDEFATGSAGLGNTTGYYSPEALFITREVETFTS
ncbi:hypothetical protein CPB85DRAFT_1337524 [Mucidula mucida]|nr:hypothetical protein CPB85DRAFT_1337524 [Mucidula mucida]